MDTVEKSSEQTKTEIYFQIWKKGFVFGERATRQEFWLFFVINAIINLIFGFLSGMGGMVEGIFTVLWLLFILASVIPTIAVMVRRLHDTGRSGRWAFLQLIPLGGLILLVMLLKGSEPGTNKYGANSKELS